MSDWIRVRGARVHNLKNIDLDIPKHRLVVITGVSGSGKSSLAFDTLYAEGQRRYVESLSAYARQFLGMMERPDVDAIEGLSPAISIEQKTTSRNPRSTVGTITEIYDYLRLLFARVGTPRCYACGREIASQSASQIIDALMQLPEGTRLMLLAPIARGQKGEFRRELARIAEEGFVRVRIDGTIYPIEEAPALEKNRRHTIEIVVDRLVIRDGIRVRLADSVETALRFGDGVLVAWVQEPDAEPREEIFSERYACAHCGISYPELEPRLFSFNSPIGACPACDGLGFRTVFDPELIVPDPSLSLAEGAIEPFSGRDAFFYRPLLEAAAKALGVPWTKPWRALSEKERHAILYGKARVWLTAPGGRRIAQHFPGVIGLLERRYRETESEEKREELLRYINEAPCPECGGARITKPARHVYVGGKTLPEVVEMPLPAVRDWVRSLELSEQQRRIAERIVHEVDARLGFLMEVGLGYLTLGRMAGTLSGGEAQRIRLASQIGSGLTGVLYILDEPSIGLHQRDNDRLIATLKRLRDLGNTVIVVEHDEDTIRAADWIVDMGPGAGEHGGRVVAAGPLSEILKAKTLTADYLTGRKAIPVPKRRRIGKRHPCIAITGCREHNLKGITFRVPLARFVCVTGVSGSGKSTLVNETFYRALARAKGLKTERPGAYEKLLGAEKIGKVIVMDQSPIGRTPRSNPATYTGVFTPIRELFAMTPEARARGYKPGRFSFNVKGGRCEACQGDGVIKVEMHFLPDVYVPCESCGGKRYNRETLDIRYRGKNIAEVLEMTVEEAARFFAHVPPIRHKLETLQAVGLGYIRLGQPATTLSGGEAQRVKLARELARKASGDTLYILDEPTTGLHFDDIAKLLHVLHALVDRGNTVVVIEHNLEVIKTADWIVDLGPEGGDAGGKIVVEGTPEEVARCKDSWTGRYLARVLGIAEDAHAA